MINYKLGDIVRVDGGHEAFKLMGYFSATRQFLMWPVRGPFRIISAETDRLKLVR
jgi:hypothetical protein